MMFRFGSILYNSGTVLCVSIAVRLCLVILIKVLERDTAAERRSFSLYQHRGNPAGV